MRTGEDLFSFSVWSEYSVVKKLARWTDTNDLGSQLRKIRTHFS